MKVRVLAAAAVAAVVALAFTFARAGDPSAAEEWEKGKKFYDEKSYKKALEHFTALKKLAPDFKEKDELNFRMGISYLRLRQWDAAEPALKEAAKGADQWKLRSLIVLGQTYRDWPHQVYTKGDVRKRGEWMEGSSYEWTQGQDIQAALECFEGAKKVGYELRELYAQAMKDAPKDKAAIEKKDEEVRGLVIELNFELSVFVMGSMQRQSSQERWKDPPADAKTYDPKWTGNEKVVFLLDEIARIDASETRLMSARSARDKALFVLRRPWWFEIKPEDTLQADAIAILRKAITDWPKSGIADEQQFTIARIVENQQQFVDALVEFRKVVDGWPDSKWVSDAKAHIQEIEAPRLSIGSAANWIPGQKIELPLSFRNLKDVKFTVTSFDLEGAWSEYAEGGRDNFEVGDFAHWAVAKGVGIDGEKVKDWTFDTEDDARHAWRSQAIAIPAEKGGAYLVTAESRGITARVVVLVSDLVIVETLSTDHADYFVADAATGAPVQGAELRVVERSTWWDGGKRREEHNVSKLATDADGRAAANLKWGSRSSRVQAFAKSGARLAATPGSYFYSYGEGGRSPRIYTWTDRPVYRPGQTVHFRATVRTTDLTGYTIPADRKVHAEIRDPKGNVLLNQDFTINDFGSISGEVKLAEEPPLGWYYLIVNHSQASGNFGFGVEEYKKPEVLVEVVSKTEQAKLGEGLTAEIQAFYYFGGGVPNADVHYRVTRSNFQYWWRRSEEFDWYYGGRDDDRDWDSGEEVILDGTGKTDQDGKLLVEWSTLKAKQELGDRDHEYRIHCEVTDSSRRTIEGSGSIRVTRTQLFATLTSRRGFYTKGDHVEIELNTQNANGKPLPSTGTMTVARMTWDASIQPNGNWKEEPFYTEDAKTDDAGQGFWRWQCDREGYYAFTYATKDAWGEKVEGKTFLNVADPDAGGRDIRYREVEMHPEKRTWRPGETARLLLTADRPGATVLLTTLAQHSILSAQVIRLKGKTHILEIPLKDVHCPNFFVRAVTVRDGGVHQEQVELFVPPADKFLDVTLTPSKPEYKPGEHAKYEITVKDWKGKPASAEVGLTVFDKSVLYIRPESVGDIRTVFYGGRRYSSVSLQSSRQWATSPYAVDTNKYEKYKTHGDPMGGYGGHRGRKKNGDAWSGAEGGELGDLGGGGGLPKPSGAPPGAPREAQESDHNESADSEDFGKVAEKKQKGEKDGKPADPGQPPPVVRQNFADTAYWTPWVVTGADGKATVEFDMPDSLTTWRASARGMDKETRVGGAVNEVATRKNLMIRLQAPRFFRERDELLLSAIVNNQGKTEENVKATLKLEGGTIEIADKETFEIKVSAGGEARVDWKVKVVTEGLAKITVTGIGQEDSDAMMMEFPVYVHGMDKLQSWAGVVKGDSETATFTIDVPADRKVSTADLVVQVSPTMMGALLEALPYLIDYPYGCVEQTMSRFMPAVTVAKTMKETGVSLEDIGKRRALAYADLPPTKDPVFHTEALAHIVEQGLARLYSFQNGAGGWGWWQSDQIDPFITAYVVNGLRIAKSAGAPVDEGRFQNGVNALKRNLTEEKDLHRAAYCAYVLAECGALEKKPMNTLYDRRGDMNSYGRALMAMAMFLSKEKEKAEVCIRNMEDFVKVDEAKGLAWWDREDKWAWWYWYGDDVEGNSAILRAYLMVDEKNPNVPRLAKWLLMNRDGVRWKSTRDTAHAILALTEYAKKAGELSPEYTADVEVDGKLLKSFGVTADNVFTMNGEAGLRGDALETGKHTITIRKSGKGTAYWSVFLKYFTKEEDLKAGSSKMDVSRAYYRLHPKKVETNENGRKVTRIEYEREELKSGAKVTSGDLIEVEMTITAPNDYEYLVFEDMKPAGVEPTEVRSGYVWGSIASNMELRDEKVAFFVSWLPRGSHKISYKVRAEIPGSFHAMPVNGYAMYAPSVRAISDEFRINIEDKPAEPDKR